MLGGLYALMVHGNWEYLYRQVGHWQWRYVAVNPRGEGWRVPTQMMGERIHDDLVRLEGGEGELFGRMGCRYRLLDDGEAALILYGVE